ncbi:MAG: Crp/Fnr family transcriptional regulator [Pseudomonadota bacterium]|nr:Crp/Fnr family transcriptional regulator [Pseudomonadota bacterium]
MGASEPPQQSVDFQRLAVRWFRLGGPGITVRQFERDQPVYREQDPSASMMCLDSGTVKILVDTPDGRECPLALKLPGELLGELCVCGQARRRESAIALERATVRSASPQTFMEFVHRENLTHLLLEHLATALVRQQRAIAVLLLEPSERRLAHTLLELSQRRGCEDGQLPLRLSQQQLGDMIGTTRSRVGLFLKHFRGLGLVVSYDQHGVHVDRERLEAYCR